MSLLNDFVESYRSAIGKVVEFSRRRERRHGSIGILFVVGIAVLLACFLAGAPFAWTQSTDGVITGVVNDPQGGVLPGVTVTAVNLDTGLTRAGVSVEDGQYRVAPLPPGTYNVRAELPGFASLEVKGVVLTIGLQLRQNLALQIGGVQESVTVTAEDATVQTASSEVGSNIIERFKIDSLPISQRQVGMLALLEPGTTPDVGRVSRPLASIGAGAVNAAGSNYLLDGLSNAISGNGDPRDIVQQAIVQEFKVIVAQAPAEYGGRAAGVVTVASKGGTNQFHGEAFEYFRNQKLNRVDTITQKQYDANPVAYPIPPFSRHQFGAAIGGPVVKDKVHFLFSFEELSAKEYFTVSPGGGTNAAVTAAYQPLVGSFRGGVLFREYFGRADWQINSRNSAFIRFSEQKPATNYAQSANGGNAAAFSSGDSSVKGFTWALIDTWVISPTLVNQIAAQYAESYQLGTVPKYNTPSQYSNGSIQISFPNLRWGFYPSTQFHAFYQELRDDVTKTVRQHTFKFGVDLLRTPRRLNSAATPFGVWTFARDYQPTAASPTFDPQNPNFAWSTLASAIPIRFTTTFPNLDYKDDNLMSGFYAQDEWKIRFNLTLNLGVRYDVQTDIWRNELNASLYPRPLPYVQFGNQGGDFNNLAPRIGFAWDPWSNGRTAVRGGFGIVNVNHQDNAFGGQVTTLRQTAITINGSTTNPVPWPDPYSGLGWQNYIATHPQSVQNVSINANDLRNPQVFTYSLGVAQQLTPDLVINVEGMHTHMKDLIVRQNVNTPDPVTSARPLPEWNQINVQKNLGIYNYSGLFVRLDKRFSGRYQYVVSYTLAKQYSNYGSGTAITDFYNPSLDRGPADTDRRHMLVASGSVLLPYGITTGAIWTMRSALPFNALAGSDLNGDGAITDYVPGTSRNSRDIDGTLSIVNAWRAARGLAPIPLSQIQSNRYLQLDARVSKDFNFSERFKVQVIGQLFNVLGTNNYGGVGTSQQSNASSSTWGAFTAALPRQQAELAVRLVF